MEKYKKIPDEIKKEEVIEWIEEELHRMYFHDPFLHKCWILANHSGFEGNDVYKIVAYNTLIVNEKLKEDMMELINSIQPTRILIPSAN